MERHVLIPTDGVELDGTLDVPDVASAIVVFAHGTGSSRLSPRNIQVAAHLRRTGRFGTLLFDLLTPAEDLAHQRRFDIDLLTERLLAATHWLLMQEEAEGRALGYFGASTGAAAALRASVMLPDVVEAIVSRGGRPDLAGDALPKVHAATLLIVGGADHIVLELNRETLRTLGAQEKVLRVVAGATHLFEEPGALQSVEEYSLAWFEYHLARSHYLPAGAVL